MKMKRMLSVLLTVLLLLSVLLPTAFAEKGAAAEERLFQKKGEEGDETLPMGVIPSDVVISPEKEKRGAIRGTLPSKYNSNEKGYITPVRSQSPYATCWAHGNMGAVEASMVRNGVIDATTGKPATKSLNLSEYHIAWFSATERYDALGMLEGDSATPVQSFLDGAGNDSIATYTLMAWEGPASEVTPALAYSATDEDGIDPAYAYDYDIAHVQDAIWIPMSNRDAVKQAIMLCGGGTFNYFHETASGSMITGYYCYQGDSAANHDILVVGWDDTFSKDKFKNVPEGDGAWICKNSWGSRYGNNGYFYISYYDTTSSAGSSCFYQVEAVDNYDFNYQYDGGAGSASLGKKDGISVANVFVANGSETLRAVSAANFTPGLNYTVTVYAGIGSTTNPTSGTAVSSQSGTFTYAGYHTVELDTPVPLEAGERFSVVFTFSGVESISVPVDKSGSNAFLSWTHTTHPNTSYYKSANVKSWTNYSDTGSFRIKAYTDRRSVAVTAQTNNASWGTVSAIDNVITATPAAGYYAAGYTVTEGTATVTQNGNIFTVEPEGTCTVRIDFAAKEQAQLKYYVDGSLKSTVTVYLGDSVTLAAAPSTPEGYHFAGWGKQSISSPTTVQQTLYAAGSSFAVEQTTVNLYAVFSYEGKGSGFRKITTAQTDWSGTYVIATADGFAMKNSGSGTTYLDGTQLTVDSDTIQTSDNTVIWTVSKINSGKYTIQDTQGKYLCCKQAKTVSLSATANTYCYWTFGVDSIAAGSTSYGTLQKNRTMNRFTTYTSAQTGICLFAGNSTVVFYTTSPKQEVAHQHVLLATAAHAATCTAAGNTAYWYCSGCNTYFSDSTATKTTDLSATVLPALGHSYLYTESATGHTVSCTRCSYSKTESHSFTNGTCICGAAQEADYSGTYYIAALRSGDNGIYQYLTSDVVNSRYAIVSSNRSTLPVSISSAEAKKAFRLTSAGSGTYYLQALGLTGSANYLTWVSGNTGAFSATGCKVTVTAAADGAVNISLYSCSDGPRYLAFNSTAANKYAAWYKTGTKNLYLIPVTGTVAVHSHSYVTSVIKPTCTAEGYTLHSCTCGESYKDTYTAALGHALKYVNNGTTHTASCSRCTYLKTEAHSFTNGTCVCGASETQDFCGRYYIAAVRSGDNGVYQYLTSTVSSKRLLITSSGRTSLPTSITNPEEDKIFILTKNTDGTYYLATAAGKYVTWTSSYYVALDSTGERLNLSGGSNGSVMMQLADSAAGGRYLFFNATAANKYAAWYASGVKELYLIPVSGTVPSHTHSYKAVATAPTCTAQGYTTHTCACGESYKDSYVPALGHDLSYKVTATKHTATCSRCSYSKTSLHSYTAGVCVCGATNFSGSYYIAGIRTGDNGIWQYMTSTIVSSKYALKSSNRKTLPSEITSPDKGKVFEISKNTDGTYYIKSGEKYLSWTSGNTGSLSDVPCSVQIVAGAEGTVQITLASDSSRYLAFNSTASYMYAAWYRSGVKNLHLIPVTFTRLKMKLLLK